MLRGPVPAPRMRLPVLVLRLLFGLAVVIAVSIIGAGVAAYSAYTQLGDSLKPRLEAITHPTSFQTTRIYDRNNVLLYEFVGTGKRTRVPLDQISTTLISSTVAIEDKTFFQNTGVDYEGILKAFARSLSAGEETGGASTITQQVIKRIVLTDDERSYDNRYRRKLTEIVLAQELSQRYTKKDILELYLNEIYYGNLAYGIEAASNVYFDTHANELTLPQASLLAGLPQLPTVYDPINYLEGNTLRGVKLDKGWLDPNYLVPKGTAPPKRRQVDVLRQLVDEGYVTEPQARRAAATDLVFASQEVPLNAPHFVFYVRKLLEEQYGQQFANEGLSIYTTLDLDVQHMVQEKAAERIQELEERNIHNAAVVVMQPNSGQILAMVGSIDYNKTVPTKTQGQSGNVLDGQVNVTTRDRQPGSALKPFTYLSAMEQGMTPGSVIWDVPTEYPPFGPRAYKPLNYNGRWNGPVRIRTALANSLNMPAVKALKFAGIDNTIDLLHRAGITGLQRGANYYGLTLTLGGGEVTPLDLTTAYNTLASGGRYYAPVAILKIVDGNGKIIQQYTPSQPAPVLNPDHVAIISNILSDDKARAPVWGLNSKLKLSRPAAVKTGTTNDWKDAWAVGYTPYVTVGVWTGNNNNEETAKVESLTGGGIIWHNVMEELFANPKFERLLAEPYPNGRLPLDFKLPDDVKSKSICPLPGAFGNFNQELFAPDMLKRAPKPVAEDAPSAEADDQTRSIDGCTVYKKLTVAVLDNRDTPVVDGPEGQRAQYCIPADGADIDPSRIKTIAIWNFPPPDPDEKVEYRWDSGGASSGPSGGAGDDKPASALNAESIPPCTAEMLVALAPLPPGAIHMPDLRLLGENQAKEKLAALGITDVYVDYQTRDRIPDVFDNYGPYVVISSLPAAGEVVLPGTTVVLGIRSPDEAVTPWPAPTTPSDQPLPEQPTPEPPPPTPPTQPSQPIAEPGGNLFGPTPTP